jgi:spore maturation protein CgeB
MKKKLYYLAPYCFGLEDSLANAFQAQGLNVRRRIYAHHNQEKRGWLRDLYNRYGFIRKLKKSFDQAGVLNSVLGKQLGALNEAVLSEAAEHRPDLIFIVKGEVLYPETLKKLRTLAPLVSYHWDDPFLRYAQQEDATSDIRFQNIRQGYGLYDLTFVYDESYIEPLQAAGARRAIYLMDWYEPEIYKPLTLSDEERARWGGDIAFVGSPYPNRLELLKALSDSNLAVWGPEFRWREHFRRHPFLKKAYRGEAPGEDAVKIYNAAKISLNIHDTFQCNTSVNNRTFQILAAGGFELVDDRERLYRLFDVGRDLASFHSPLDAAQKAAYFLARPDEREAVRRSGQTKSAQHSATQRAAFILEQFRSLEPSSAGAPA